MYNLLKQYRNMRLKALLLGHGLTWTSEWYENTGEASDYVLAMDSPYPVSKEQFEWSKRFKEKFGVEPSPAPSGQPYDYTRLAMKSLNKVGTLDFEKLVKYFREEVKYSGVWQYFDWATYNDFWKDFAGEATLHALSRNDVRTGEYLKTGFFFPMAQMMKGKPNIVWPNKFATAEFKLPPWL